MIGSGKRNIQNNLINGLNYFLEFYDSIQQVYLSENTLSSAKTSTINLNSRKWK